MPASPSDPPPITVRAGQATTLDLGGGADLIIPPGAMTAGAKVHATYAGRPAGTWDGIRPAAAPVQLISDPPDAIHGLLILEFPVPKPPQGVDPSSVYGISTYDQSTGAWTPYASSYDAARGMVVAQIPHFSWWNPFSWDWAGIAARVNQDVGQVVGRREGAASCTSSAPSWVGQLAGVVNDADVAVRSCAQSQGDVLDVELVNNRPYGMVLKYGSSVKWGWHDTGSTAQAKAADALADKTLGPNELYLPPLSRASVGIFATKPGSNTMFQIGPTVGTEFVDFLEDAADYLDETPLPDAVSCVTMLSQWSIDLSPSAIRDNIVAAGGCMETAYLKLVASGALDKAKVDQLSATLSALKSASMVGQAWSIEGDVWQLADLWADQVVVGSAGSLGNGFSVYAKATPYTPPPAPSTSPVNHPATTAPANPAPPSAPPNPAPTTQAPPPAPSAPPAPSTYPETVGGPTHTWTNYTNAGGTEGPTVPSFSTVQIACKLTGFKVADGNTWWYRIASPGWDGNFYASADAFYNNGQTSGPLHGTPFVDNAIPYC